MRNNNGHMLNLQQARWHAYPLTVEKQRKLAVLQPDVLGSMLGGCLAIQTQVVLGQGRLLSLLSRAQNAASLLQTSHNTQSIHICLPHRGLHHSPVVNEVGDDYAMSSPLVAAPEERAFRLSA